MMFAKLCAIILIFLVVGSHSLQVFVGNTTKHFFTPAFAGNKSPIINGQIISYIGVLGLSAKDLQTCDKASPSAFVNQSIAIVAPFGGCATERHIEVAQNAGAVAVIIVTDQMWRVCQTTDVDSKSFKNRINAVCITREDFNVLIAILINNGNQNPPQPTIAIFSADPNEYQTKLNKRLMDWGTITFFIVFVGIGGVSVFRLVQFFMKEGISFTIPKLLLIINIYATLTSAITVIDLQGYRNWYNTMQFQTTYYYFLSSAALYQFIIFSGYIANILVKVSEHKKLVNIANYSITGFFMVGYTVVNIVLCIYGYTWNLNKAVGDGSIIVIAIISGMSSLFFLFASIFLIAKLTSFVSLTSGKSEERKKKYVMLSALLMFAFVVILGACVLTIAIAFKSVQDDIQAFFVIYFLLNCCIVIWHSIVILVFNPRDAQKRSNSSTGTKSLKKSSEFNRSFNENNKSFNSLDKIDDGAEL